MLADPTPPRIPEPGTWGVVEAGYAGRIERARGGSCHDGRRSSVTPGRYRINGTNLTDPVLIRDGIDS